MKGFSQALLTLNGGYVDTASYLALQGLFSSHVTGNFVTLGVSIEHGGASAIAKLLALPTFCLVVALARLLGHVLRQYELPPIRFLLVTEAVLLSIGATLAVRLGPFPDGDSLHAIVTGMTLVAAMAIQNAVHRVHLPASPPSTIMTGTSTQIMLDLADMMSGRPANERAAAAARVPKLAGAIAMFAGGCALSAGAMIYLGMWSFALPPMVAGLAVLLHDEVVP